MFGKNIRLFTLFGFKVKIDLSWFVIVILITWSLAKGLFPYYYKNLSATSYWCMGISGAFGLFFSIVFHEFSHSLIARKYGIPIQGITLFIFGGVAEMKDKPPDARSEFMMAIAGPLSSVFLGLCLYGIHYVSHDLIRSVQFHGVIQYCMYINFLLAAFNLLPAFPLDGGRVLRSALWGWKNNLRWATHVASQIGMGFGITFITFGIFNFIMGNFITGIWWFLIGMFLRNASYVSYQQLLIRKAIEGEKVEHFMRKSPITVSPSISINQFLEDYFYRYHYKMFPVAEDSKLLGCIMIKKIKSIPRVEWDRHNVAEIIIDCSADNTIDPDADAIQALSTMRRTGNNRLMVVKDNQLVGIITLKDLIHFLSLKLNLEDTE